MLLETEVIQKLSYFNVPFLCCRICKHVKLQLSSYFQFNTRNVNLDKFLPNFFNASSLQHIY